MKSKGADRLSRPGLGAGGGRVGGGGYNLLKGLILWGGGGNLFCFLVWG